MGKREGKLFVPTTAKQKKEGMTACNPQFNLMDTPRSLVRKAGDASGRTSMLLTCPRLLDSVNAAAYAVCTENTINVCHDTCVGRCSKKKVNIKGKTNSTSVGDGSHDK